jgi:predicted ATP-dependent endonuclease of OLD family
MAEGFFAKGVVLVEGAGDRAALVAVANTLGKSFEAEGIAILPVGGKASLDRPCLVFRSLGIPTYVVWDSDCSGNNKKTAIALNACLQRLADAEEPHSEFPTAIKEAYSCFEDKLETTLYDEIGKENLVAIIEEKIAAYGFNKHEEALKSPVVMSEILGDCNAKGLTSKTLSEMVERIFEFFANNSAGANEPALKIAGAVEIAVSV